jgi:hypothetical protein
MSERVIAVCDCALRSSEVRLPPAEQSARGERKQYQGSATVRSPGNIETMAMRSETVDFLKAALDFLKALVWPATILVIVAMFRRHLKGILGQFSDRFRALEKVKFGSAEISYTAENVANSVRFDPQISEGDRQVIDQNWHALSDPMTDVIALKLWRSKAGAEQLAREIMEPTRLSGEQFSSGFMYTWTRRAKKNLDALQALGYVDAKDDVYELTDAGRAIFKEVVEHEDEILARFKEDRLSL